MTITASIENKFLIGNDRCTNIIINMRSLGSLKEGGGVIISIAVCVCLAENHGAV